MVILKSQERQELEAALDSIVKNMGGITLARSLDTFFKCDANTLKLPSISSSYALIVKYFNCAEKVNSKSFTKTKLLTRILLYYPHWHVQVGLNAWIKNHALF